MRKLLSVIVLCLLNSISGGRFQVWLPSYSSYIDRPLLSPLTQKQPCCNSLPKGFEKENRPAPNSEIGNQNGILLEINRKIGNQNRGGIQNPLLSKIPSKMSTPSESSDKLMREFIQLTNKNIAEEARLMHSEKSLQVPMRSRNAAELMRALTQITSKNVKKSTRLLPEENPLESTLQTFNIDTPVPTEIILEVDIKRDDLKAFECSQLECGPEETEGPLCACNYKTGNTVSFKNECDIKKHNCRFDTDFKTILHEICPWQFESRSGSEDSEAMQFNYEEPRYFNGK